MALNKGIPIVSTNFLSDLIMKKSFKEMKITDYIIANSSIEQEYNFSLRDTLDLAKLRGGFLNGFAVWVPDINGTLIKKQLEKVIISAGGTILNEKPEGGNDRQLALADWKNKRLIDALIEEKIRFITRDGLMEACFRQNYQ